jgi:hypothetical protein
VFVSVLGQQGGQTRGRQVEGGEKGAQARRERGGGGKNLEIPLIDERRRGTQRRPRHRRSVHAADCR